MAFMLGTAASQLGLVEAVATLWTPANLPTAPCLWVRHRNAVWSGNNLASIANAGSAGGSGTVGSVVKGAARGGFDGLSFTSANGVPLGFRFNGMGTGTSTFFAIYRKPSIQPQCLLGSYGHWSPGNGYGVYVDHTENGFLATGSGYGNLFNGAGGDDGPCFHDRDGGIPHDPNDTWMMRYVQMGAVTKTRRDGNAITPYIVKPKTLPGYYGSDTDWSVGAMGGGEFMGAGNSVAELMLFNVNLSQTDLDKLEGWAAWEYATTDRLPSGHPYKTAAPTV